MREDMAIVSIVRGGKLRSSPASEEHDSDYLRFKSVSIGAAQGASRRYIRGAQLAEIFDRSPSKDAGAHGRRVPIPARVSTL